MSDDQRHPGVDAYLDALPDWRGEVCRELRDQIHASEPEIEETTKRRVQPYFLLDGHVCALQACRPACLHACKDQVNLFLYDGAIVPDPDHIITGGHDNTTARTISFYRDDRIPSRALTAMLRQIAGNDRAGGWRKLKQQP